MAFETADFSLKTNFLWLPPSLFFEVSYTHPLALLDAVFQAAIVCGVNFRVQRYDCRQLGRGKESRPVERVYPMTRLFACYRCTALCVYTIRLAPRLSLANVISCVSISVYTRPKWRPSLFIGCGGSLRKALIGSAVVLASVSPQFARRLFAF